MTHSGGKAHAVGDKGQRFEVSYFDPEANARKVMGWSETTEGAQQMADCVENHPSWGYPQITDRNASGVPPVDRTQRTLTDGSPVPDDYSHTQYRGDGQQKGYIVLSAEERAKGFVRPVRQKYVHVGVGGHEIDPNNPAKSGLKGNGCGALTHMGLALAETYARDPKFYNGTFCAGCKAHFPLDQFVWDGTEEVLGT